MVVLLLNIGNTSKHITASWADIGLSAEAIVSAMDLWTGNVLPATLSGSITATVASHDSAVFRLSLRNASKL